jgi:hypothetical protein
MLAVISGVFIIRVAFLGCGYPDSNQDWNAIALVLRSYGSILLLVPVVWATAVTYLEQYGTGRWSKRWTVCTGILLLATLVIVFMWIAFRAYDGRMRVDPVQTIPQ